MLVKDNFNDGNTIGWKSYDGTWSAARGTLSSSGGKALLDTNFSDFTQDADITLKSARGDAGVAFRVTQPAAGTDNYRGYYAGFSASGRVVLGKANGGWTPLASATVRPGLQHHLRVTAVGSTITVYVDDMATPRITVTDATYTSGANGVRAFNTAASFDDFSVAHN
jgi:hypothetical protein